MALKDKKLSKLLSLKARGHQTVYQTPDGKTVKLEKVKSGQQVMVVNVDEEILKCLFNKVPLSAPDKVSMDALMTVSYGRRQKKA